MNKVATIEAEVTAPVELITFKPQSLVSFRDGIQAEVDKIATEARALVAGADVSTPAGRDIIRSTAYKVARSKTALDDLGAGLVAEQKRTAKAVDESRRAMRDKLDALKDEVRKPLTDFERAEEERVAEHEKVLREIVDHLTWEQPPSIPAVKQRIESLSHLPQRDWQEFKARAQHTLAEVIDNLTRMHDELVAREAAAAAAAKAAAEEAERLQRERDEKIASEAAAKAKREAEEKAAAEAKAAQERAAAEAQAAEQRRLDDLAAAERARKAEQERAARAEREAEDAKRRAAQAAADAVKQEQQRVAAAQAAEAAATKKREEDKKHRAKINAEARDAIVNNAFAAGATLTVEQATSVVVAIAKGEIPHITISY